MNSSRDKVMDRVYGIIGEIEHHAEQKPEYRKRQSQLESMIDRHLQTLPEELRDRERAFVNQVLECELYLGNLRLDEVICRLIFRNFDGL